MPALYAGSRKPGTHTHTVVRTQDLQLFKLVVHIRAAEKEEEERERNGIYKKREREKGKSQLVPLRRRLLCVCLNLRSDERERIEEEFKAV